MSQKQGQPKGDKGGSGYWGLITNSRQSTRASLKKQISEHAKHM